VPLITLPWAFGAADVVDSAKFNEDIHSPAATPDSLDVINGQLDGTNFAGATNISKDSIQQRANTDGKTIGATANLDYFAELFKEVSLDPLDQEGGLDDLVNTYKDAFVPIPNAGQSPFFRRAPDFVYLSWSISWASDGGFDGSGNNKGIGPCWIMLFADGVPVPHANRMIMAARDFSATPVARYGATNDRVWTGCHVIVSPSQGWHNYGLRLIMDKLCKQVRIRVRNFSVNPVYKTFV
jgi:hypothetical protein